MVNTCKPFENLTICPVFRWFWLLEPRNVKYLNVSGIWMFIIQIRTKSDHSKSENIQNSVILKIGFWMVQFSMGWSIAMVPTIRKTGHSNLGCFCLDFKWFWQKAGPLKGFQMVMLPNFRSYLKTGPFANQPLFDHSKSRHIRSPLYTHLFMYNWIVTTTKLCASNKLYIETVHIKLLTSLFTCFRQDSLQDQYLLWYRSERVDKQQHQEAAPGHGKSKAGRRHPSIWCWIRLQFSGNWHNFFRKPNRRDLKNWHLVWN